MKTTTTILAGLSFSIALGAFLGCGDDDGPNPQQSLEPVVSHEVRLSIFLTAPIPNDRNDPLRKALNDLAHPALVAECREYGILKRVSVIRGDQETGESIALPFVSYKDVQVENGKSVANMKVLAKDLFEIHGRLFASKDLPPDVTVPMASGPPVQWVMRLKSDPRLKGSTLLIDNVRGEVEDPSAAPPVLRHENVVKRIDSEACKAISQHLTSTGDDGAAAEPISLQVVVVFPKPDTRTGPAPSTEPTATMTASVTATISDTSTATTASTAEPTATSSSSAAPSRVPTAPVHGPKATPSPPSKPTGSGSLPEHPDPQTAGKGVTAVGSDPAHQVKTNQQLPKP